MQGKLVPTITLGPFLTLSVRNGPSFSFGTNVPCKGSNHDFRDESETLRSLNEFEKLDFAIINIYLQII